jgi:IQ calmodulin-binding motif
MSNRYQAAVKIQSLVRGWLCRTSISRKSRCSESRLKNFFPVRKPPVYRKKLKSKSKRNYDKKAILIQKNIRGYLQRKKYKELLIDKMLKEQEDHFRTQIEKIQNEIDDRVQCPVPMTPLQTKVIKPSNLHLELPLPVSQRRSPSKYRRKSKSIVYEYDYFITAAIEIQRIFRGYIARKFHGNFKKLRNKIIKLQRLYRSWRNRKEGQLELALALMNKQCNMLSTSFTSYQHLKSLILAQDRQGKYTKFISHCEDKLSDAGINSSNVLNKYLEDRIRELEQEKIEQENNFKEVLNSTKSKYRGIIADYLKDLKAFKFGMQVAQRSNFEQISRLVKSLAGASRDLESESFYDNSTFLPDVSFIEKSINII